MTVVEDQISAQLAELTRIVPEPQAPFGYGRDLSCTTELDPNLAEVDPFSTRAIAEALLRRYITPAGSLEDDPDYGEDIRGAENMGATTRDLLALSGKLRNEGQKDDRVDSLEVTVSTPSDVLRTRTLNIKIYVHPRDANQPSFAMTLACSSGEVILEAIG